MIPRDLPGSIVDPEDGSVFVPWDVIQAHLMAEIYAFLADK